MTPWPLGGTVKGQCPQAGLSGGPGPADGSWRAWALGGLRGHDAPLQEGREGSLWLHFSPHRSFLVFNSPPLGSAFWDGSDSVSSLRPIFWALTSLRTLHHSPPGGGQREPLWPLHTCLLTPSVSLLLALLLCLWPALLLMPAWTPSSQMGLPRHLCPCSVILGRLEQSPLLGGSLMCCGPQGKDRPVTATTFVSSLTCWPRA